MTAVGVPYYTAYKAMALYPDILDFLVHSDIRPWPIDPKIIKMFIKKPVGVQRERRDIVMKI